MKTRYYIDTHLSGANQKENSCSGELYCRAKDTAGPYEIDDDGDKRKWVKYKCYCSADKTRFEFLGPTATWGEPYNAYGVEQTPTVDNWGNWSVNQTIERFPVNTNVNTNSWYSNIIYKTDFIDAFKTNNQHIP
ncbi:MAG: hypothetical protein RPT11_06925 [Bermanella sp.]